MRLSLSIGVGILLGLVSGASHGQTVQSTLSISLTAEISVPTVNGSKFVKLRLGTSDIVDGIKDELGITGRGGTLVERRQIDDFETPPETYVIVDKVAYLVPDDPIDEIDVGLPESYFAEVEAVKLRKSDGVESEIKLLLPNAFSGGNLEEEGFEMTLVGLEKATLKLLTQQGVDLGYVLSSRSIAVTGGMILDDFDLGQIDGVVTGTIRSSSEKIVP